MVTYVVWETITDNKRSIELIHIQFGNWLIAIQLGY